MLSSRSVLCNPCNRLIPAACIRCQPALLPAVIKLESIDLTLSVFEYGKDAAFLIKLAKYKPYPQLLKQFGNNLKNVIAEASQNSDFPMPDCIITAPSHPKLLRKRGFNPARLIAGPMAEYFKVPLLEPFKRDGRRAPQAKLSLNKRRRNMLPSIHCTAKLPPTVMIIDDVLTSGSTLQTLAQLARKAGAMRVIAAVLCNAGLAVDRRFEKFS